MKKILYIFTLTFALFVTPVSAEVSTQNVQTVEAYLDSLKTLKAKFTQTAYDGSTTTGMFYLSRPGRLRFEYDAPIKDFIVADGVFIYYYDAEMKQQSNTTIGNSLADFLLRKDISLSQDITVTDTKTAAGLLQITLTMTEDPGAGSLTLGFETDPMRLKKWRVTDSQGLITEVELSDIETGIDLKRRLFYYVDPEHGKPQYN